MHTRNGARVLQTLSISCGIVNLCIPVAVALKTFVLCLYISDIMVLIEKSDKVGCNPMSH